MTPLESDPVPASFTPFGDTTMSFLAIDNPNVVMSTWKRAEDGDGSIVRLTEISGRTQAVHLATPHLLLDKVQTCSLLEECNDLVPVRDGSAVFEMKPFTIITLRLVTSPETKP
jgi:alpha-mannosidase